MSDVVLMAAMAAVSAVVVLLTLWLALVLVQRSLVSLTAMCIGVVRTLLGQTDAEEGEIRYESDVGNTTPLFESLPGWQYWGDTVDGIPEVPRMPEEPPEGPHLGGVA
jgi:hypothetical protein